MILYITVFVITVLIASGVSPVSGTYTENGKLTRQGVVNRIYQSGLFMLLFLLSALRINTGNDYQMYITKFHEAYTDFYVVTEPGFNYLTKAIYKLFNCEQYLVVFAVFSFLTVISFLVALRQQAVDYKLSFFLFMAFGFYFQSLNTVRYYLALAIVFYSMRLIIEKKYFRFLLAVCVAALFHKSSLIVIIVFALAKVPWKKWCAPLFAVLSITGLLFEEQYMKLILKLYPSYVNEEEYILAGTQSIINIGRCILVLILCIAFYKESIKDNKANRFYMNLNIFALSLYTCFTFIPFLSRIGYYLTISQIILVPNIIKDIADEKQKRIIKRVVIVAGVVFFIALLMKMSEENVRILPYSSWITEPFKIEALAF